MEGADVSGARDRPNIVLVTVDSLRADVSALGARGREVAPTLSAMADDGISFERAIAPGPSTPESMPVAFTGQYPVETVTNETNSLAGVRDRVRRHMTARDTLVERLSRAGYETAAFTPNPFTSRHFGFDHGFDHFQDFMPSADNEASRYERVFETFLEGGTAAGFVRMLRNFWRREEVFKPWESYYDEIRRWIDGATEPWFVWVFLMDAHNPYLPGSAYRSQSRLGQFYANYRFWREDHETPFSPAVHDRLVTAYLDAVTYADAGLSRLREDLAADDPVFVVHGDHGEAFGEHGSYGHEPYLHPENVHVPLVVEGLDSRTVTEPFSVRRLPELVNRVASRRVDAIDVGPWATTRTADGRGAAVYMTSEYYVRRGGGSRDWPEPVVDSFTSLLDQEASFQRERGHIVAAVREGLEA